MQADAVSRAKEMYSRRSPSYEADGFPKGYNGSMKANGNTHSENQKLKANDDSQNTPDSTVTNESDSHNNPVAQQVSNVSQNVQSTDILTTVLADKERALIILLIALLNEENASPSLMLALMYLII